MLAAQRRFDREISRGVLLFFFRASPGDGREGAGMRWGLRPVKRAGPRTQRIIHGTETINSWHSELPTTSTVPGTRTELNPANFNIWHPKLPTKARERLSPTCGGAFRLDTRSEQIGSAPELAQNCARMEHLSTGRRGGSRPGQREPWITRPRSAPHASSVG